MPIDLDCPSCGRVLRVADKYAGRLGTCPACKKPIRIPDDSPELEILPEDRRTYSNLVLPPPEAPPPPETTREIATPINPKTATDTANTDEWRDPRLVRLDRLREEAEAANRPRWWNREFISLFGLSVTPLWLLLIPLALTGFWLWYVNGPGRGAAVRYVSPVFITEVLATGEVITPGRGPTLGQLTPGAPGADIFSVGGRDELFVTSADPGGDFVLIEIGLQQRIINNQGQVTGNENILKAGEFTLRRLGEPAGSGTLGRLVTTSFDQPLDLELAGAQTSNYRALLPSSAKPDDLREQKIPGVVNGEAEYALGRTRGTVSFTASRTTQGMPAINGLSATGRLTITHPDADGPGVTADYRGGTLNVSWDPGARGHWATMRMVEKANISPWGRTDLALLFPRPADAGKYTLSFAGRDVATVKLRRASRGSTPAPSPIASNRPGGPQPQSKQSNSPLAYFDVLTDARSRAKGLASANHMRQIGIALMQYTDQNRGRFPESLLELRGVMPQIEQLMTNPRTGDRPGFIYEPPAPGSDPSRTPVLYESLNGQKDPNGAVLYGDGSVR
ncbi:MAG: hypothetical protein AAGH99_13995 [Planctomycetota bacterium]